MKGLLIDVHNAKIQEVEVSELDDYYKWIGCENIDITSRKIGGRIYPMRRKTPCFSYGDIRRVHRIYASN